MPSNMQDADCSKPLEALPPKQDVMKLWNKETKEKKRKQSPTDDDVAVRARDCCPEKLRSVWKSLVCWEKEERNQEREGELQNIKEFFILYHNQQRKYTN